MPMIAMPMNCAALLASPMGLLASKVGLIPALLGLGLLIAAHEAGHMLVARWMGMRVEVYSLGFGPRMWGFTRGDTEYRVSWFPLGGYCRIAGFTPDDDGKYDDSDPGSYLNKPAWRRFLVILAGPGVNWIAAIFLVGGLYATVGFMEVDPGSTRVEVVPGGPAAAAGMQDGDQLLAVDGVPLHSFEDLIRELHKDGAPAERTVTAQRGAETLSLRVRPESGRIQVGYARERRRLSWLEAAPKAVAVTWELTKASLGALGLFGRRRVFALRPARDRPAGDARHQAGRGRVRRAARADLGGPRHLQPAAHPRARRRPAGLPRLRDRPAPPAQREVRAGAQPGRHARALHAAHRRHALRRPATRAQAVR